MGGTSIYRLTIPEMARLRRGFEVMEDKQRERTEAEYGEFNSAKDATYGRVRDGDRKALQQFANRNDLKTN